MSCIDHDLISQNSPLYDYLKSADSKIVDELIDPDLPKLINVTETNTKVYENTCEQHSLKSLLYDYVFDEDWKNSQKKLYYQFSKRIIDHTLKSNLLNEYDASYVKAFAESNTFDNSNVHSSDSILNQMFTQMSVLCITIGYALMRLIYVKSSSDIMPSCLFVYSLDILSLFMTILALMPVAIRFSSTGKLVGQIRKLETSFLIILNMFGNSKKLFSKSYLFIHEMEVLQYGYTFLNAPICRLEKGLYKLDTERRYSDLRFEIYKVACSYLLALRKLSVLILTLFPKDINLQGIQNCCALDNLQDIYDVPLNDREKILNCTDNLSLQSIKSVLEMLNLHVSEFFRISCLNFFTQCDLPGISANQIKPEMLSELMDLIKQKSSSLQNSLNFHKNLTEKIKKFDEKRDVKNMKGSDVRFMQMLLRSLLGHLHTAFTCMSIHENELEKQLELIDSSDNLSEYFVNALSSDLDLLKKNVSASQDCCEEIQRQINIYRGVQNQNDQDILLINTGSTSNQESNMEVINDEEPIIIEDEVYEAFITENTEENDISDLDYGIKSSHSKDTAKVLSELKNVITERADLMNKREEVAIQRRNQNNPNFISNLHNDLIDMDENIVPTYKSNLLQFRDLLKEGKMVHASNNKYLLNKNESNFLDCSNSHFNNESIFVNADYMTGEMGPNVANLMINMSNGLLSGIEETFANDSDLDSTSSESSDGFIESEEQYNYNKSSGSDEN